MNWSEKLLLDLLKLSPDRNMQAAILQSFIAEFGPLGNEAGEEAKKIMLNTS